MNEHKDVKMSQYIALLVTCKTQKKKKKKKKPDYGAAYRQHAQ